jgi:hypothetical protein
MSILRDNLDGSSEPMPESDRIRMSQMLEQQRIALANSPWVAVKTRERLQRQLNPDGWDEFVRDHDS